MWRFVLIACAGCGRIAFDERVASDATPDVPPSGADCWSAWRSGAPTFSTVAPIAELADPEKDGNPWLTADGTTLYWDNGTGDTEIYRATRTAPGQPFGARTQLVELTSAFEESGLVIIADGTVGVIASTRPGSQGFDLWQAERQSPDRLFGTPRIDAFSAINDANNQFDAFLTADGKRVYYATSTDQPMQQVVRTATRASATAVFGPPVPIAGMGNFAVEADPDLSPDELVIVFAANLPLTLYAAVRPTTASAFGTPFPLTAVVGSNHDADPALSANGCELFFISDRGGNRDPWRAVVTP